MFPFAPFIAFCSAPSGAGARVGSAREACRVVSPFVGRAMSDAVGGNSRRFKRLSASFRVADPPNSGTPDVRSDIA